MASDVTFAQQNAVLQVHLRMRYSKNAEQDTGDLVYDVADDDPSTLIANAPSDSATFKNANRNHTSTMQRFKFSSIFLPSTTQMDFFQLTASPMLEECLNMESNCLLFTYGVTNSGKTYTVQGPAKDAGLIPRSLDLIFNSLGAKIKPKSMHYPYLFNDVVKMTPKLQQQRETIKQRILYPVNISQTVNITGITDSANTTRATQGSLLSEFEDQSYQITDNATTIILPDNEDIQYSVWISYVELYNETLYDLLEPPPKDGGIKSKSRPALRLGDDHAMAVYIKGSVQLEVTSTAEAYRAMAYGNRNKKMAATAMNHSSSRSHSIFKITIIATNTVTHQSQSSQISFVDLAGSERYGKTNALGTRLKEAGSINTSLLTLGKCISSLRHNQNLKSGQQGLIVPFRDSKLTRLFKTFLSGEGSLAMVVCVNPNPECYDETLHALKFSALASEVIYQFKPTITTVHNEGRLMTREDLAELEWEIKKKIEQQYCKRMDQLTEQHIKSIEDTKAREMEYHDGVMEDLNKYYDTVVGDLKDKVRAARAQAAGTENNHNDKEKERTLEDEIARLKKRLQNQIKTSELTTLTSTYETQLAHVRLELKTTRSMYKDSVEEKERLNIIMKDKDTEIKMYFQSNEELTKSATFWEKELTSIKATLTCNEEVLQEKVKERDVQILQLRKELEERDSLERKLVLENQELATRQTSMGKEQVDLLKEQLNVAVENLKKVKQELYKEKEMSVSSKGELCQVNTKIMELENEIRRSTEEKKRIVEEKERDKEETEICFAKMKSTITKDKKEIEALTQTCNASEAIVITLKSDIIALKSDLKQKLNLLSEQGHASVSKSKALFKENSDLKEQVTQAEETINEKELKCNELEEELYDIVRNKSLQFDTIIGNKEREVDTLCERNMQYENEVCDLKQRIVELEELASVQKHHLATVESESVKQLADYKIKLSAEIKQNSKQKKEEEKHATILEELKEKLEKSEEEQTQLREERTQLSEQLIMAQSGPQDAAMHEKSRLDAVLARQELQRVQIELAAAKRNDSSRQLQLQIDAKDIELDNWYIEKEKAVTMISVKKEKEIGILQDKIQHLESLLREKDGGKKDQTLEAAQDQLAALKADSMNKLEELADMVVQREKESDYVQNEFNAYKRQVDELVTEKEKMFGKIKKDLESSKRYAEELKKEKETLEKELESVQSVQVEEEEEEEVGERTNSSSSTRGRSKVRKSLGKRRTSQTIISSKTPRLQLHITRSRTSRIAVTLPESPELEFATPEQVGVKRKATFKGLKNLMSSGSKKGKSDLENLSESDSGAEFQTPTKITATSGKRKLCKTQISSPLELLPVPHNLKVKDIEKTTTRSRAKLIKQHLSGSTRKTRSRVTTNSAE